MSASQNTPHFQLSPRDLLILLLTLLAGVCAGTLLWHSGIPGGQAVIGGFDAAGATLLFLDNFTKKD